MKTFGNHDMSCMYGSQQLEDGCKRVKTAQKVYSQAEFGEIFLLLLPVSAVW